MVSRQRNWVCRKAKLDLLSREWVRRGWEGGASFPSLLLSLIFLALVKWKGVKWMSYKTGQDKGPDSAGGRKRELEEGENDQWEVKQASQMLYQGSDCMQARGVGAGTHFIYLFNFLTFYFIYVFFEDLLNPNSWAMCCHMLHPLLSSRFTM